MYHDSRDEQYRRPFGACPCGRKVRLRLRAEEAGSAWLRLWWQDHEILHPMRRRADGLFQAEITLPEQPGLLWYFFVAETPEGRVYYGNGGDQLGGEGCVSRGEPPSFQITVYDPAFDPPHWLRDGVMLQIMVDRYRRAGRLDPARFPKGAILHRDWNETPLLPLERAGADMSPDDFFGGNLRGIEEKLDYIRSLGVTVLYLNPIFLSHSNHKYDVADYTRVDPSFGTEEDFRRLCRKAGKLGIRVILDGVFSHTGADSVYFDRFGGHEPPGAYQSRESPYYSWYRFEKWPDKYKCWWDFLLMPDVNEDDPSYREFILGRDGVARRWLLNGASGWRLDVADELPVDFIRRMRAVEKQADPNAALIGEVWEDPSNKVAYGELRSYCLGDTLDCAMNYPLRQAVLDFMLGRADAARTKRLLDSMAEKLPVPFLYSQMNLLGSHDRARAISVLADCGNMEPDRRYRYPRQLTPEEYARGSRRFAAAWALVCALPGMPSLYYGDEAGMTGMTDPFCRGPFPWGREDAALTQAVRAAALLRRGSSLLRRGRATLYAPCPDVLLVERFGDAFGGAAEGRCLLAVNRGGEEAEFRFGRRKHHVPAESAVWLEEPPCEI